MGLKWIVENPPQWDESKERLVGAAPEGIFDIGDHKTGELIPGEWWRVEDDAGIAGYGWMDCTWGDAEILLAVASSRQNAGVGSFILDHLEKEAAGRGLHYLYNLVRPTHPDRAGITAWLGKRGFARSHDDDLLKRPVRHPS
jgi:GNAT superfamily N-acetyltransferase